MHEIYLYCNTRCITKGVIVNPNLGTSTITIEANTETVWAVLADEFVDLAAE